MPVVNYDTQIEGGLPHLKWYTRLGRALRGYGCVSYDRQDFPVDLIGYIPKGKLHRAAGIGAVAKVNRLLMSQEYHVDATDKRDRTALHYACSHNQPDIVSLLIKKNCNINALDDEKCTPLTKATQRENEECVSILLEHGADPHAVDVHGNKALHYAVFKGNIWVVEMLLACSADIEARTKRGFTPYLLSVLGKNKAMAEFLKSRGANANTVLRQKGRQHVQHQSLSLDRLAQKKLTVSMGSLHAVTTVKNSELNSKVLNYYWKFLSLKYVTHEDRAEQQPQPTSKKSALSRTGEESTTEKSLPRFSRKPRPDVAGPPTKDNTESHNNKVDEEKHKTPSMSYKYRIATFNETMNTMCPPAIIDDLAQNAALAEPRLVPGTGHGTDALPEISCIPALPATLRPADNVRGRHSWVRTAWE